MKKLIVFILNIILACSFLMPTWITASAEEAQAAFALKFALTADDGQSSIVVEQGDVITVSFSMHRTDSNEDYTINGFQNYIHYDHSLFEFVENSIVCNDTGSASAQKLTSIEHGDRIQCQNMGKTYTANFVFCTFQLEVIGASGTGTIYSGEFYVFDANYQEVTVAEQNLQVAINDCAHTNRTKVDAKNPTCDEDGWNAYYYCGDCEFYFDESGENLIDGIPYIEGGHKIAEVLSHDENGHWYACADCEEKSNYAAHSGGEATCTTKATCTTCGQEYGDIDEQNHADNAVLSYDESGHWYECTACEEKADYAAHGGGVATCKSKAKCETCLQEYGDIDEQNHTKTYVVNDKDTLPWEDGYTGDEYCSECEQLIEAGEIVSRYDICAWPWWIFLLAFLFAFLIIAFVVGLFNR